MLIGRQLAICRRFPSLLHAHLDTYYDWRKHRRRGISSGCLCSWLACEQVYVGELRSEFSRALQTPFWTLKIEGAWNKWDGSTRGGRGRESLPFPSFTPSDSFVFPPISSYVSRSHFLGFRQHPFFFRPVARLILPPVCIVFHPRLLLFPPWAKERKSLKRPRPVASSNWIRLYYGLFSFVLLNILRHIANIPAALLFCSTFSFGFPRYLLWSLAQSSFVPRDGLFVTSARFLLSWNLEFFCFNPEQNKRKSFKFHARSVPAIVLLIFFCCFQARSSNLHSVCGQQDGVSQWTSERHFSFLGLSPPLFRFQSLTLSPAKW